MIAPLQASYRKDVILPHKAGHVNGSPVLAYAVGNKVGESPCWHSSQGALYWIDVRRFQVLKLQPETSVVERWQMQEVVGALALCQSGKIWVALKNRLAALDPSNGLIEDIAVVETARPNNRLNDGKVSPSGRWFIFGSMDDRPIKEASGALYRASGTGEIQRLFDGLTVCNGIAFSTCTTTIYFSDSSLGRVYRADWDEEYGTMGSPELHCILLESDGRPDGATVDSTGVYWSAGVSAGCLNLLSVSGERLQRLQLPCRAPTMPAFASAASGTLFVTSLVRPEWTLTGEHDGSLLAISVAEVGVQPSLLMDQ